jgi:hypothetical protein
MADHFRVEASTTAKQARPEEKMRIAASGDAVTQDQHRSLY